MLNIKLSLSPTGCPVDPIRRRAVDIRSSHPHIITPREVTSGFRGGSLSSRNILQLNGLLSILAPDWVERGAAQAHRLGDGWGSGRSIRRRIRPGVSRRQQASAGDGGPFVRSDHPWATLIHPSGLLLEQRIRL
ncbi:nephrocystin-4 isoform X1 [Lates japonicus]|uniref:Nephrocystin-4 isoform X1 n=1 Tax=Lates japonicus TaxID=270547 RepID=A0AAD3RLP2_LATJO|nr:nephrocystin-4 isoform X1 [Lates japonicus]